MQKLGKLQKVRRAAESTHIDSGVYDLQKIARAPHGGESWYYYTHCWYSIVLQIILYFTPFSLWSAHRRPGLASSDACVFVWHKLTNLLNSPCKIGNE